MTTSIKKAEPWERVFVGSMWPVYNFDDANARYANFLNFAKPRFAHLIDGLLLYDRVVIPTQDFLSLTVLIVVLGERAVLDLLANEDLKFIRLKGAFAYAGNGGGLIRYEIGSKNPGDSPQPAFMDNDHAVDWAISGLKDEVKDPATKRLVLEHTQTIEATELDDIACKETYLDVMNSPYLKSLFPVGSFLERLPGIPPNSIRTYDYDNPANVKNDLVDLLLRLSTANIELKLADLSRCQDTTTLNPVGQLLKGKVDRSMGAQIPFESWLRLLEVSGPPNVPAYVLEQKSKAERGSALAELLRIKRARDGEAFRKWFHTNCRGDPNLVAREYVELLRQVPAVSSLPVRIFRFLATTAIGLMPGAGAVLGTGASLADSFFLDGWFRGASPKVFIDDLGQIVKATGKVGPT